MSQQQQTQRLEQLKQDSEAAKEQQVDKRPYDSLTSEEITRLNQVASARVNLTANAWLFLQLVWKHSAIALRYYHKTNETYHQWKSGCFFDVLYNPDVYLVIHQRCWHLISIEWVKSFFPSIFFLSFFFFQIKHKNIEEKSNFVNFKLNLSSNSFKRCFFQTLTVSALNKLMKFISIGSDFWTALYYKTNWLLKPVAFFKGTKHEVQDPKLTAVSGTITKLTLASYCVTPKKIDTHCQTPKKA